MILCGDVCCVSMFLWEIDGWILDVNKLFKFDTNAAEKKKHYRRLPSSTWHILSLRHMPSLFEYTLLIESRESKEMKEEKKTSNVFIQTKNKTKKKHTEQLDARCKQEICTTTDERNFASLFIGTLLHGRARVKMSKHPAKGAADVLLNATWDHKIWG